MALRVGVHGITFNSQDGGSVLCGIQPGVIENLKVRDTEEVQAKVGTFETVTVSDAANVSIMEADVVNGTTVNATDLVAGDGTFTTLMSRNGSATATPWHAVTACHSTFNLTAGMAAAAATVPCQAKVETIDRTWYEVTLYIPYVSLSITSSQQYVSLSGIPEAIAPESAVSASAIVNNSTGIYEGLLYVSFSAGTMYLAMKSQWKSTADNWVIGTSTIQAFVVRYMKTTFTCPT